MGRTPIEAEQPAGTLEGLSNDELRLIQKMSRAIRDRKDAIYEQALAREAGALAAEVLQLRAQLSRRAGPLSTLAPSEN